MLAACSGGGKVANEQFTFLKDLGITVNEKLLLADTLTLPDIYCGDPEQSVMGLGYGYLYYPDNQDTEQVVKNLKTGKEYRVTESVRNTPFISGEGIYLPGDGKIKLWKYETENVEEIGSYPDNEEMIIQWVSRDYVYAIVFFENGYKTVYYKKDEFMKGHLTGHEYVVGN